MAATSSSMLALGTPAPDFSLPDSVSGSITGLSAVRGVRGTVIFFICNHCPYVKHVNAELVRIGKDYSPKGIGFAAISSNDVLRYPEDSPAEMKRVARALGYPFPYLYDESQSVAHAYQAACTPDTYVFDSSLRLVYRGQLDDSRPSKDIPVTGRDLRTALDALLTGKPVSPDQKPGIGCSIKWK